MIDDNQKEWPTSVHAEMTILGAMLVDPLAITEAVTLLDPDDFALDSHKRIYRSMLRRTKAADKVDIVTISNDLDNHKELASIGGRDYLFRLSEDLPRKLHIGSYVRIVREKARLRDLINTAQRIHDGALDQDEEAESIVERSIGDLRAIAVSMDSTGLTCIAEVFQQQGSPEQMFETISTVNGVKLGFGHLDEITGGAQPGELWIVAARPSMGKTAWMCNTARHTAVAEDKISAVFTLEQKKEAIIRRMLSSSARIDSQDIKNGSLRSEDRRLLLEHRRTLSESRMYLDDTAGLTVSRIHSRCMRLKAKVGLDIVFIDQLSKVSRKDVQTKGMPKYEAVGEQAEALKRMAQDLDVPVVLFNQLGRGVGQRKDSIPTLADLKESGELEEDADVVVLLHRQEYYDRHDLSLQGKGQMIIAKNREGETKTLNCLYQGKILRWEDDYEPAAQQDSFSSDYYNPPYYDR